MDGKRLDSFSRALARGSTRRQAMQRGSAVAAFGAAIGLGARPAATAAQDDATCTLPFSAQFATGADAGVVIEGELTLVIDEDGAIDEGQLAIAGGDTFPLVGTAYGRLVAFRLAVQDGGYVAFNGAAQDDVAACQGELSGTFGGPVPGSTGTWAAGPEVAAGTGTTPATPEASDEAECDECEAPEGYTAAETSCDADTCLCSYDCSACGADPDDLVTIPCTDNPDQACAAHCFPEVTCEDDAEACDGECYFLCEPGTKRNFEFCSCDPL